jgi:hypothetical protein
MVERCAIFMDLFECFVLEYRLPMQGKTVTGRAEDAFGL